MVVFFSCKSAQDVTCVESTRGVADWMPVRCVLLPRRRLTVREGVVTVKPRAIAR